MLKKCICSLTSKTLSVACFTITSFIYQCILVVLRVLVNLWTLQTTMGMHLKNTMLHLKFNQV